MRKFICIFLVTILLTLTCAIAEVDLTSMTNDELSELYNALISKIQLSKQGDTVYDQDGISIIWKGAGKETLSFIISNNSGKDFKVELVDYALNGMLLGTHWNMKSIEVKNGLSFLSTSNNIWKYDDETIEALGISHINSVMIILKIQDPESSKYSDLTISFAVDDEIQ